MQLSAVPARFPLRHSSSSAIVGPSTPAQILHEQSVSSDLFRLHTELLNDNDSQRMEHVLRIPRSKLLAEFREVMR